MEIKKIDSAKQQIETAVSLYFNYGDPVSIHTLAAAAFNILKDIFNKKGKKDYFLKNPDLISEPHKKEFLDKVNEAENFFKHADRDHDRSIEFNPEVTDFFLFEGIRIYYQLTGEYPPIMGKFVAKFFYKNPDLVNPDFRPLIDEALNLGHELGIDQENRDFFRDLTL